MLLYLHIGNSTAQTLPKPGCLLNKRLIRLCTLQQAQELKVIDSYSLEMAEAVADADCVIIATPVGAMAGIFKQLAPFWSEQVLYMDAGSTKGNVVTALHNLLNIR
jgi:prephenate dehydrogenase